MASRSGNDETTPHDLASEEALRASEERFRTISGLLARMTFSILLGPQGEARVESFHGHDYGVPRNVDLPVHRLITDDIHPDDAGQMVAAVDRLRNGEDVIFEYRVLDQRNAVQWMRFHARSVPVAEPAGGWVRVHGAVIDITEEKLAEERISRQQAELAHVSRLSTLGQMVAVLAHEIAQPLAAIGNYAAVCEMEIESLDDASAAIRRAVHSISQQASRAGTIVQQLRGYARRGQQRRELCNVNSTLQDSVTLLGYDRGATPVVHYELADSLPRVFVDRVQIQQVFVNLLKNAWEAGEESRANPNRISIRTSVIDGSVEIEVIDSGAGLNADQLGNLFQAFFTTKPQGLGVGLAICRTIVESYGGTIEAENVASGGACFRVRLPAGE